MSKKGFYGENKKIISNKIKEYYKYYTYYIYIY